MSKVFKIKRFADSKTIYNGNYPDEQQDYKHWIELECGKRLECDGGLIDEIYNDWVLTEGVTREDDEQWSIFVFPKLYVKQSKQ